MDSERINPAELGPPSGFSHAVSVTADRMVFLAGQLGAGPDGAIVPGGIVAQFEQGLANVLTALAAAGCGSPVAAGSQISAVVPSPRLLFSSSFPPSCAARP